MLTRLAVLSLFGLIFCSCGKKSSSTTSEASHSYEGGTGFLGGKLVDTDGNPVEGATIGIVHEGYAKTEQLTVAATTNSEGVFQFGPVPEASYTVKFIGAHRSHPNFTARANQGNALGEVGTPSIELTLEPWIEVEIPFVGDNKNVQLAPLYVDDPIQPLINGLSQRMVRAERGATSIKLRTLQGTLQVSPDPAFSEGSEISTFKVGPDGLIDPDASLPSPGFSKIEVQLKRSDGKPLDGYVVAIVPTWIPSGSVVEIFTTGGYAKLSKEGLYSAGVPKGLSMKAVVVAKGCKITESETFVPGSSSVPIEVILTPAESVTTQISLTDIPEEVLNKVEPSDFTLWFRSPSGYYIQGFQGWKISKGSNNEMSFDALPAGEEVLIQFWRGGPTRYNARSRFTTRIGLELNLEVQTIEGERSEESEFWNGQWWLNRFLLGDSYWRVPVQAPRWFEEGR